MVVLLQVSNFLFVEVIIYQNLVIRPGNISVPRVKNLTIIVTPTLTGMVVSCCIKSASSLFVDVNLFNIELFLNSMFLPLFRLQNSIMTHHFFQVIISTYLSMELLEFTSCFMSLLH